MRVWDTQCPYVAVNAVRPCQGRALFAVPIGNGLVPRLARRVPDTTRDVCTCRRKRTNCSDSVDHAVRCYVSSDSTAQECHPDLFARSGQASLLGVSEDLQADAYAGALVLAGLRAGTFLNDIGSSTTRRVVNPQSIVGRSPDADVQVADPTNRVSRFHLLVELTAGRWLVRDCGSTHGSVAKHGGRQVALPAWTPQPVIDGMVFVLAGSLEFKARLERPTLAGQTTAPGTGPLIGSRVKTVLDDELLPVAMALTAPYRESPPRIDCATVSEMLEVLPLSRSTLYNRLRALGELPAVQGRLRAAQGSTARTRELAAVLVALYPALTDSLGTGNGPC